jgi:hypothetical protein
MGADRWGRDVSPLNKSRIGKLSLDQDWTAHDRRLPQHGGSSPASSEDSSTARARRRGCRTRRRCTGSAAVLLLLRFPAAACFQVVDRGGAPLVQYCAGGAGYGEPEREGVSGDVWEVAGDEVRLCV